MQLCHEPRRPPGDQRGESAAILRLELLVQRERAQTRGALGSGFLADPVASEAEQGDDVIVATGAISLVAEVLERDELDRILEPDRTVVTAVDEAFLDRVSKPSHNGRVAGIASGR